MTRLRLVSVAFSVALPFTLVACDPASEGPPDASGSTSPDGGEVTTIPDTLAVQDCPYDLAFDDTHVYFATASAGSPSVSQPGLIGRVPLTGGEAETLAAQQPKGQAVAVTASHVWWTTNGDNVRTGNVRRRALGGGEVEIVSSGEFVPLFLKASGAHLWFTAWELRRLPTAGGAVEVFFTGPDGRLDQFVVDETHAYFGENTFHPRVFRVALADRSVQPLSDSPVTSYETRAMVSDATHLYFISSFAGQNHQAALFRLAKDGSGGRVKLADLATPSPGLQVVGDALYVTLGGDIVRFSKTTPGTSEVAIAGAGAGKLWQHAGRFWWTSCSEKTIRSAPIQ